MITVFLHEPVDLFRDAAERNYDAPEPFVFPNPAPALDQDGGLTCLSIIREQRGGVVTMKIVLRSRTAE